MTSDEFRKIVLALEGSSESLHMGHPDFRMNGKIFATLQYPDENWGMVKLPLEQQDNFVQAYPKAFVPVKGTWGRQGSTSVLLNAVDEPTLKQALHIAWGSAAKSLGKTTNGRKRATVQGKT
jgi:hypothetical protein